MMTTHRHTAASLLRPALLAVASASVVLLGACSSMGMGGGSMPPTVKVTNGALTDPQGLTLYTFDRDPANGGKSVCNATCATNWPPLLAEPVTSGSGSYTIAFPGNVSGCASTATLGGTDATSQPPGFITVRDDGGTVGVQIYDTAGNPADRPCHVIVAC